LIHLPVFGLVLTLGAYLAAYWLHQRTGRPGVLSPVLVTTAIVATVLLLTGLPYQVYLEQVSLLTMLLGPATVALALPLLRNVRAGPAPRRLAVPGLSRAGGPAEEAARARHRRPRPAAAAQRAGPGRLGTRRDRGPGGRGSVQHRPHRRRAGAVRRRGRRAARRAPALGHLARGPVDRRGAAGLGAARGGAHHGLRCARCRLRPRAA